MDDISIHLFLIQIQKLVVISTSLRVFHKQTQVQIFDQVQLWLSIMARPEMLD